MKIRLISTALLAASVLLVACSSTPEKSTPTPSCIFADGSNKAAPDWVCGAPISGFDLFAVGYSDKSDAGPNFMKQMAATAARAELAQVLSLEIQNMIKQYAETTGTGDLETVDRVNTSVTKQVTDQKLVGSKIVRQMPTPSGGMIVLVALDPTGVEQISKDVLRTSMDNDRALYQQFKAEQGFDELADEIVKYRQQ